MTRGPDAVLVPPDAAYRASYLAALAEMVCAGKTPYEDVAAAAADFPALVARILARRDGVGLRPGAMPSSTFWLVENGEFVGDVEIRHTLNEKLRRMGGHIGYDIRPSWRRRGYGTRILALALPEARRLGITRALLTCDDLNEASWRIIEANGGVLEDVIEVEGSRRRRYWIELGASSAR